ncbi:DUF11 domain-containing protein [Dokdonella immobilis]|uniref:Conserved repeat domain-containing protein n=1 Tax=Dokdonella immobilis TaxID=578942 RepID=A0A1I4X2Y0_9GAMM|nr:DUF11 domain-containing protein [Dokdonella immobilis]SFN20304.1 conserved repeat domain-containing protein [Dokdonella immobilis]
MKRTWIALIVFALMGMIVASPTTGFAQSPPPLPKPDLTGFLMAGNVLATAGQPDGSIILGGNFTSINGEPRRGLARLQPDGTLDPVWNPSVNIGGIVYALSLDADGSVFVGGLFDSVNGIVRGNIAKVSGSGAGAVDPDWNPDASLGVVHCLQADDLGSIYVGGSFAEVGGQSRANLARLATSGSGAADSWNPSTDGEVRAMALDGSGSLFVGGHFTTAGGQPRASIAKLSVSGAGSADPDWNPSVVGYGVFSLALEGPDRLYAGGDFSSIGGFSRGSIAKLSITGSGAVDSLWNPAADAPVYALLAVGGGTLYVGGEFHSIGGQSRNGVAKLYTEGPGPADALWNPGSDQAVATIVGRGTDSIVVGGWFEFIGGAPHLALAAITEAGLVGGLVDVELGGGYPQVMLALADGGTVIGGRFAKVDGRVRQKLLRLEPDGSLDPDWHPMLSGGSYYQDIRALAEGENGEVYVGGDFTLVDGVSRNYLARIDAAGHLDLEWNPSPDQSVGDFVLDSANSALYVAGEFDTIGGAARNHLAKLSTSGNGEADTVWNPAPNGYISALALGTSSALFVAGDFTMIGGLPRARFAKLSGTGVGSAAAGWNPGVDDYIYALTVDVNGDVYAGGKFLNLGGLPRNRIARVSAAGSVDGAWNPSAGDSVAALTLRDDALYAGGAFTTIGGASRSRLARLSKSGAGTATAWNPSPNSNVYAIATDPVGPIRIAGTFVTVAGQGREFAAALPPADVSIVAESESPSAQAGDLVEYRITIGNSGASPASGIALSASLPPELPLSGMAWSCTANAGSSCGSSGTSGSGNLPASIDVSVGGDVEFLYSGTVVAGPADEFQLTATAIYQGEPLRATAITRYVLFRNGFDPAVSN